MLPEILDVPLDISKTMFYQHDAYHEHCLREARNLLDHQIYPWIGRRILFPLAHHISGE